MRTVPTGDQLSVSRHEIHQTSKSQLHRIEIFVNIRMIEFDVVDDRDLRQVMHELRTLVEVCSVVLVAFDNEVVTVGHAKADAEIPYYATHQESRIQSCLIDYPCGQTRRRGFAVRSCYHERTSPANKLTFQYLR